MLTSNNGTGIEWGACGSDKSTQQQKHLIQRRFWCVYTYFIKDPRSKVTLKLEKNPDRIKGLTRALCLASFGSNDTLGGCAAHSPAKTTKKKTRIKEFKKWHITSVTDSRLLLVDTAQTTEGDYTCEDCSSLFLLSNDCLIPFFFFFFFPTSDLERGLALRK